MFEHRPKTVVIEEVQRLAVKLEMGEEVTLEKLASLLREAGYYLTQEERHKAKSYDCGVCGEENYV